MTLPLTPAVIEAAYDYLRATSPFKGWKLPPGDEVEFGVTRHRDREADHTFYKGTDEQIICVSSVAIKTTDALMQALAHEMVHVRQVRQGIYQRKHGASFLRMARRVCKCHGWDVRTFV